MWGSQQEFTIKLSMASINGRPMSVTLARFDDPYSALIGCSDGFCSLCGFEREYVVGRNCRFINQRSHVPPRVRERLRQSIRSGVPFMGVINNSRHLGEGVFEDFENLLHLVLLVAGNIRYILAIQADVTGLDLKLADGSQDALRLMKMFDSVLSSGVDSWIHLQEGAVTAPPLYLVFRQNHNSPGCQDEVEIVENDSTGLGAKAQMLASALASPDQALMLTRQSFPFGAVDGGDHSQFVLMGEPGADAVLPVGAPVPSAPRQTDIASSPKWAPFNGATPGMAAAMPVYAKGNHDSTPPSSPHNWQDLSGYLEHKRSVLGKAQVDRSLESTPQPAAPQGLKLTNVTSRPIAIEPLLDSIYPQSEGARPAPGLSGALEAAYVHQDSVSCGPDPASLDAAYVSPNASHASSLMASQHSTMKAQLQALNYENPDTILVARGISKLGYSSGGILTSHFSQYGLVKTVLIPDAYKKRKGPQSGNTEDAREKRIPGRGFIVMTSPEDAAQILAHGPDHLISGVSMSVELFNSPSAGSYI